MLRESALQRFCERVLAEVSDITRGLGSAHARYLDVYEHMANRDREMAKAFDAPRRSTALAQLVIIFANDLLTQDEVAQFSPGLIQELRDLAMIDRSFMPKPGRGSS